MIVAAGDGRGKSSETWANPAGPAWGQLHRLYSLCGVSILLSGGLWTRSAGYRLHP